MSNLYYSTYFLTCNTKGKVLKNVHAALFYTVKVDGEQSLSSSKKDKIAPEKLHKSSLYGLCTIFQVFFEI